VRVGPAAAAGLGPRSEAGSGGRRTARGEGRPRRGAGGPFGWTGPKTEEGN
jgi:hypothetical protein